MSEPSLIDITNDDELMDRVLKKSAEMQGKTLERGEKEYVEVEIGTEERYRPKIEEIEEIEEIE